MAARDRSLDELGREQRLAAALVRRHGLSLPIPIERLAREYADVESADLPAADGCVLGLATMQRPRILLRSGRAGVRQRFTLAHELGHIILPWHLGHIACHAGVSSSDYDDRSSGPDEAEANRFAAELLVPTHWLSSVVAQNDSGCVAPLLRRLRIADVSAHVACLRLISALPVGYVFALLDDSGAVEMSGRSSGTIAPAPAEGERVDEAAFARFATSAESVEFRGRRLMWWSFRSASGVEHSERDSREASVVLADLVNSHARSQREAQQLAQRLNGITSYAYDQARRKGVMSEGELVAWLRSRFAGRTDLPTALMQDGRLNLYLRKRSHELAAKRQRG